MKKILTAFMLLFAGALMFADNTVAVLEFETGDANLRGKMPILTDIFRSELANTQNLNVVDRANTDKALAEIALQQTSIMSATNVKSVGNILNADYLVIGTVAVLADEAETKTTYTTREEEVNGGAIGAIGKALFGDAAAKTKTVVDEHKETVQEKRINIVVQLLNVETGGIVASSRLDIPKWSEFSKYASDLAKPLSSKLSTSSRLRKVDVDMFYGEWECEIANNGVVDYYIINFGDNNRVTVTLESTSRSGKTSKAKGRGRYVYSEDDKVFALTVNNMAGDVRHVTRLNWKSLVNPSKDNSSFTMTVPVSSSEGSKKVRGDFYRLD